MSDELTDSFHVRYYNNWEQTWENTHYRGHKILKCPLDLWVYHEIIQETRPRAILECGTAHGGSALWFADQLDLLGRRGRVLTVDVAGRETFPNRPTDSFIHYLEGSSVSPAIVGEVYDKLNGLDVLVVLDSAHNRDHVIAELDAYHNLVPVGGYIIVEDTNIHGHPVCPEHEPGPYEAVEAWLPQHPEFVRDESREKYYLTFNPGGYLRRVR